jgi:hypothetical protein
MKVHREFAMSGVTKPLELSHSNAVNQLALLFNPLPALSYLSAEMLGAVAGSVGFLFSVGLTSITGMEITNYRAFRAEGMGFNHLASRSVGGVLGAALLALLALICPGQLVPLALSILLGLFVGFPLGANIGAALAGWRDGRTLSRGRLAFHRFYQSVALATRQSAHFGRSLVPH